MKLYIGLTILYVEGGLDACAKSVYAIVLGGGFINTAGFRIAMARAWYSSSVTMHVLKDNVLRIFLVC